ncbi:MAG: hypothetical protein ACI8P0_005890, partial [Planctomycetaceae bacterium]
TTGRAVTLLSQKQAKELVSRLDRIQALRGTGVGFVGLSMCQTLREPSMPPGLRTWIVLQEATAEQAASFNSGVTQNQAKERESKLGFELFQMGLSCGATVAAGFVSAGAGAGAAAAAPVTGGASGVVSVLTFSAAVATAAQCGISSGRVINEIFDPAANDRLDSLAWFEATSNTLDAISIAGGFASLGQAAQAAIRSSRSSGKSISQVVKGLSRAERKRLAQDLAKYSGQAPTRKQFIRLTRQGKLPKIIRRQAISQAALNESLNAVGVGLSMIGSGTSGNIHGLIMYFVEEDARN